MLKRVKLSNFRSIQETVFDLSPTGLTVFVGANGSGKSNVFKGLDFIAEMTQNDLETAIIAQGAREGILPKAYAKGKLREMEFGLEYTCTLPGLAYYPENFSPPEATHGISVNWPTTTDFQIKDEFVEFTDVRTVGRALQLQRKERTEEDVKRFIALPKSEQVESVLRFEKGRGGNLKIGATSSTKAEDLDLYISWLGRLFSQEITDIETWGRLRRFLQDVAKEIRRAGNTDVKSESFLDSSHAYPFEMAPQMAEFRRVLSQIKTYNLHLQELRRPQPVSSARTLSREGKHLPAAYKKATSQSESNSAARIKDTLAQIAPHVLDSEVQAARGGQEFVQFIEEKEGRPVESWESSDGTLRALAILVAVETAPEDGTILIEEPEQCLHPWAIRNVVEHMREVIEEKQIQIILTTHSQHVLECLRPEELIVLTRTQDSGTVATTLSELPIADLDMGEIGDMWVDGLLGGVPGHE